MKAPWTRHLCSELGQGQIGGGPRWTQNHLRHKGARARQEFESFLGRPACIAAINNIWGPLVPLAQYLGGDADAKLAPGQGLEP